MAKAQNTEKKLPKVLTRIQGSTWEFKNKRREGLADLIHLKVARRDLMAVKSKLFKLSLLYVSFSSVF